MSNTSVLDAFSLVRRELGLTRSTEKTATELGPKQMWILYRLLSSSATMGELAEYTVSDRAATTRTVASLEKAGWVKRSSQKNDARVTVIELTAKGRTKALKAKQFRDSIGAKVESTLTAHERSELARLLNKVAQGLREARNGNQE